MALPFTELNTFSATPAQDQTLQCTAAPLPRTRWINKAGWGAKYITLCLTASRSPAECWSRTQSLPSSPKCNAQGFPSFARPTPQCDIKVHCMF